MEFVILGSLLLGGLMVSFNRYSKRIEKDLEDSLAEERRTEELVAQATAQYPNVSMFIAVNFYLSDLQREKNKMKNLSMTDMIIYQELTNDITLLFRERKHLERLDEEQSCDYNLLTKAQL
jgi:hypothetical protein